MRFFFDNNLSIKLAKSLHVLVEPEHEVVHLKDRFAANTKDGLDKVCVKLLKVLREDLSR